MKVMYKKTDVYSVFLDDNNVYKHIHTNNDSYQAGEITVWIR